MNHDKPRSEPVNPIERPHHSAPDPPTDHVHLPSRSKPSSPTSAISSSYNFENNPDKPPSFSTLFVSPISSSKRKSLFESDEDISTPTRTSLGERSISTFSPWTSTSKATRRPHSTHKNYWIRALYITWLSLFILALLLTTWAYSYPLYPVFSPGRCEFPVPTKSSFTNRHGSKDAVAQFRLLAYADPQLEGDSSLYYRNTGMIKEGLRRWWRRNEKEEIVVQEVNTMDSQDWTKWVMQEVGRTLRRDRREMFTKEVDEKKIVTRFRRMKGRVIKVVADVKSEIYSRINRLGLRIASVIPLLRSGALNVPGSKDKGSASFGVDPPQEPHTNPTKKETLFERNNDDTPSLVSAVVELFNRDLLSIVYDYRKRLDLWGNDYYLGHIAATTRRFSGSSRSIFKLLYPRFLSGKRHDGATHLVALGDLLGSQWISDEEFEKRSSRFWNRVFPGTKQPNISSDGNLKHDQDWSNVLISLAGNHDIGYAGDLNRERINRFEKRYNKVNWDVSFILDEEKNTLIEYHNNDNNDERPKLKIIMLNSMNLDSPAWDTELQDETKSFLDEQIEKAKELGPRDTIVLLTHIPLYKKEGLCTDKPFFDNFPEDNGSGIKEQNQLSMSTSREILSGLFETHRGIILNGHDHEGCDTLHIMTSENEKFDNLTISVNEAWSTLRFNDTLLTNIEKDNIPTVREITVRSAMGDFGGNTGYLSAWFNDDEQNWHFAYNACRFGVQHIWWTIHILNMIVVVSGIFIMIPILFLSQSIMLLRPSMSLSTKQKRITSIYTIDQ